MPPVRAWHGERWRQVGEIVTFNDISKSYDGHNYVVRGLELAIAQGEFLTLLGPSGSGKTTTLMMLAGFETPTSGEIYLDGKPLSRRPPHERDIGMVFQNYALFPHLTVAENLAFPLEVRRRPKAEIRTRVAAALEMVRLPQVGARRPSQLSGGQQQRVALARALVFEPRLVLMDEPLGALDKQLRDHMQYEIRALHDRLGVTVVYVTHDQSEALTMSNRIAVFAAGRVRQLATPDVLYETPADLFVATFVGESNLFTGAVAARDADTACVALDDGTRVLATAMDVGAAGATGVVMVRPEKLLLGPAAAGCDNRFSARVEDVVYHGDHLRVRLAAFGRDDIIGRMPTGGSGQPAIGSTLAFGFRATDARAYEPAHGAG